MTPGELFEKAFVALRSADLLLQSGDLDGCCNRAYYAMFDAARAALVADGCADQVLGIKTHSGLISFFSLRLVKTGRVSVELGKSFNKVEDLRLLADYRGDALELAQAQWAVEQAQLFVHGLQTLFKGK